MRRVIRGDMVMVISGESKGVSGNVLRVIRRINQSDKVIVAGSNICVKHLSPKKGGEGKMVKQEAYIDVSKVALFCKDTKCFSKVAYKICEDGEKSRLYKKNGKVIE